MKLIIKDLKKTFDEKEVLKGINFEFEKGKIYGLLGRNGAGKTTFFNCLNEDLSIDEGEFYIDDEYKRKLATEDIGYVLSIPNVPEFLTGREFLKFFIEINKVRIKDKKAIDDYFDFMKIDIEDRDRLLKDYSHGMKNKMQMLEKTIYKLYSANEDDVNQSVRILNEMGYPVSACSGVQMIMINIFDYVRRDDPDYADFRNRQILVSALDTCGMAPSLTYFLCENTLHQYVILLVSAAGLPMDIPEDFYVVLYEKIRAGLRVAPGMYVSSFTELKSLRKKAGETNTIYLNNTDHKPGIYYTSEKVVLNRTLDLKENMHRWKLLLNGKQYKNLRESIFSHVDFLLKVNKLNYADICNLHQQLTQMFFSYSYENNIDIMDLFQGEYSYNDYMDGFSDSRSLKEAMGYIITALGKVEQDEGTDVDKAKQYILDNLSKNFTVRDVAEHVHLSPEYFTKVFKAKTGQNIKNYILQVKLDVAKDLLATPNIPISMIAAEIGYDNFSHFTQIFKKYEDITPTEYRKKILG